MLYFATITLGLLLLIGCKTQERIYEVWEVDEPPVLVGDSIVIEAPPLPPESEDPKG